jgi:hypothetical protein
LIVVVVVVVAACIQFRKCHNVFSLSRVVSAKEHFRLKLASRLFSFLPENASRSSRFQFVSLHCQNYWNLFFFQRVARNFIFIYFKPLPLNVSIYFVGRTVGQWLGIHAIAGYQQPWPSLWIIVTNAYYFRRFSPIYEAGGESYFSTK